MQEQYIETLKNGTKKYYKDKAKTILHREDGPAIEYADGGKEWLVDGKYHRLDGPAIESANGKEAWCINGESISEDEFFKRTDWREDQHIVDLQYLRNLLSIGTVDTADTASELLKTSLIKMALDSVNEMHRVAMEEKRANGFVG